MGHVFIGCDHIVGRKVAFFEHVSAVEIQETARGDVTDRALSRWRTDSPKGFCFVMHAVRGVGSVMGTRSPEWLGDADIEGGGLLRDTPAVLAAWAETVRLAGKLRPKLVLVRTPAAFTPTPTNRARVEWFARELVPQIDAAVAFEPHGLWQPETWVPWARELGLVPVFDPYVEPDLAITAGGTVMLTVYDPFGPKTGFSDYEVEELLERIEPAQRAIIIFRGQRQYRDARIAHEVWQAFAEMDEE
jgi:uncharacterized protein YecE (DUF72 family)